MPSSFDRYFYDEHAAAAERAAQNFLGLVYQYIPFESVVDFGAGAGAWLRAARRAGAQRLLGIEGPWAEGLQARSIEQYHFSDLNRPVKIPATFDLAICVEVAEHLDPERSAGLVDDICTASPIVIFGAALTRQFGDGHINCRNQEFWMQLFAANGYRCYDPFRTRFWVNANIQPWYRQNTFLYAREPGPNVLSKLPQAALLNVYQPALLFPPVDFYVKLDHATGEAAE